MEEAGEVRKVTSPEAAFLLRGCFVLVCSSLLKINLQWRGEAFEGCAMPQARMSFRVLQERQIKQRACQIALKMETCLPASVVLCIAREGNSRCKASSPCCRAFKQLLFCGSGLWEGLFWIHSDRIHFPAVFESSPGHDVVSANPCSCLACEQPVPYTTICKE